MSRLHDGTDDSHVVDSAPVTAAPLTMACWFYPTPTSLQLGNLIWLGDKDVTNHVLEMQMQAAGTVRVRAAAGGTFVNAVTSTSATLDTWNHACGVFASATDRSVYLNGGGVGTNATNRAPAGIDRLAIGRHMASTPIEPYKGRIAEVAVWNVALSAAEVAALARGMSPRYIRPGALVFYAPLYGKASPEPDYTSGQRHLTVNGATLATHAPVMPAWGVDEPLLQTASGTTPKSGSDAFTLAEAASLEVALAVTDAAAAADTSGAPQGAYSAADAAALGEVSALEVAAAGTDAATLGEAAALAAEITGTDSGSVAELSELDPGAIPKAGTDAFALSGEAASLVVELVGLEAFTVAEAAAIVADLARADGGVFTDSASLDTGEVVVVTGRYDPSGAGGGTSSAPSHSGYDRSRARQVLA